MGWGSRADGLLNMNCIQGEDRGVWGKWLCNRREMDAQRDKQARGRRDWSELGLLVARAARHASEYFIVFWELRGKPWARHERGNLTHAHTQVSYGLGAAGHSRQLLTASAEAASRAEGCRLKAAIAV